MNDIIEKIYLEDYINNNKIIEYNIYNIYNHFYVTNDYLRTYKKIYYLIFKENRTIKKNEKINIVIKMPLYINGKYVRYIIKNFDDHCCPNIKKCCSEEFSLKGNLIIKTKDNIYNFDSIITIKYIKTDIYFIINYTTDRDYYNVENIGYNLYFEPQKLGIVSKNCISNLYEEIDVNINITLKLINSNINIELYFNNNNLKLYDCNKLYGTITSDFPIVEYNITDRINMKNIKIKDNGYDKELDKYVYEINSIFTLMYEQKNSIYDISITDSNFYSIKKTIFLPINL